MLQDFGANRAQSATKAIEGEIVSESENSFKTNKEEKLNNLKNVVRGISENTSEEMSREETLSQLAPLGVINEEMSENEVLAQLGSLSDEVGGISEAEKEDLIRQLEPLGQSIMDKENEEILSQLAPIGVINEEMSEDEVVAQLGSLSDEVGGISEAEKEDLIKQLEPIEKSIIEEQNKELLTQLGPLGGTTEEIHQENNETIEIKESNEVEENHEETIIEPISQTQSNIETNGDIPVEISGGTDPELLDKFKQECKAVLDENSTYFENLTNEIEDEINDLESKLSEKVKQDIMNNIQENYKDEEKLNKYINSFEEGSYEREYAELFAKYKSYLDLDGESSLSKDQKLEALISRYNSQGLEIPQEVAQIKDSKDLDELTLVDSQDKEAESRRKNIVMTQYQQDNSNESKVSIEPDSKINDIKDVELKATMSDLAKIDSAKFRVHGKLDGEIDTKVQSDIQADFESRINSLTEDLGVKPDSSINDIFNNMDKEAQRQFNGYKLGNIEPSKLTGSAKDLAIIEREAQHLKFAMNVEGKSYSASSPNEVINNLQKERAKITASEGGIAQRRNITMTEGGKSPNGNITMTEGGKSPNGNIAMTEGGKSPNGNITMTEGGKSPNGNIAMTEGGKGPNKNIDKKVV